MNRINALFEKKKNNILSVYFTAGHPTLTSTVEIIQNLEKNGVDLIEIGMPFSDPVADGTVIQQSSQKALDNGMNLNLLFEQLTEIRKHVSIPLILMGYLNPVYQFGVEKFCKKCSEIGIDGTILPDLPLEVYEKQYKQIFEKYDVKNVFLITPQTSAERIKKIDQLSDSFIYMVSSSSTTGAKASIEDDQLNYFKRIHDLELSNPRIIGFGISNNKTFDRACKYANGAIIGSAFVNTLESSSNIPSDIPQFIKSILG
jgi:tryptophan synthase alpha chain